jgi:hypothetical protein
MMEGAMLKKKMRWGRKDRSEASPKPGPKSKFTVKNVLKVIDSLQDEHKVVEMQHRGFIYRMMANAASVIVLFQRSKPLQKKFMRHAKLDNAKKGLATEVVAYIMRAKTKKARQLAWKRGRAIDFLLALGVKPAAITTELKKRGGLEAICKQAASETPRRSKKSIGTALQAFDATESRREPVPMSGLNDRWVTVQVRIRLSDLDALHGMAPGSKAAMKIARVEENDVQAKVLRLKRVANKTAADW